MSGQSPPRTRRPQPSTGQIHNVQPRETSRSPSLRERPQRQSKSQVMPPLVAAAQIYSHSNATQQSLQSSPPIPNAIRRSPPPGQAHRMLPTPPHPMDPTQERRSVSPAPLHPGHIPGVGVPTHYQPRPVHNSPARVLDKYQQGEWEYPDHVIADMQQVPVQQQLGIPPPAPPQLPHMNSYPPPPTTSSYSRDETVSPPKDPVERVRVTERASPKDFDHTAQRRREQPTARESPKTRDRQQQQPPSSASPNSASFSLQNHSHSPENRGSPYHTGHGSQVAPDYSPYLTHDPTTTMGRRNTVSMGHQPEVRTQQVQQQPSVASQTPPSAVMSTRADRSLPVQEEAEDDVGPGSKNGASSARDSWKSNNNNDVHLDPQRVESPHHDDDEDLTSDETEGSRYDGGAHPVVLNGRDEKPPRMGSKDDMIDDHRYGDHTTTAEEYTPRSPTSTLPDNIMDSFPPQPPPASTVKMGAGRPRPRSGATDQLGLHGLDALVEQNGPPSTMRDPNPPPSQPGPPSANDQSRQQSFSSLRKPVPDIGGDQMQQMQQQQQQQQQQSPQLQQLNHNQHNPHIQHNQHSQHNQHNQHNQHSQHYQHNQHHQPHQQQSNHQQPSQPSSAHSYRGYDPRDPRYSNNRYYMYDGLQNYPDDASVYFDTYIQSPRPDAPIPPSPHSASAAPSPAPHMYDRGGDIMPPYSPIAPVGSPYPFPFGHVRRPAQFQVAPSANNSHHANNINNNNNGNNNNGNPNTGSANVNGQNGGPSPEALLREQYAKQWQIYAQNNNWGAMSDSTFSPAPTPFQGAFSPWAHWHTQKIFGRGPAADVMSLQSSPSHEPVPLPSKTPLHVGVRKSQVKERGGSKLRRETSPSVSPPRKPPPRVESTQPRDTSPEPSSSGEETAGEESYSTTPQSNSLTAGGEGYDERWAGVVVPVGGEDEDEADWVDEDEEVDPEDLLNLQFHPSYVRTGEKRRRRWEIGWEALTQAFQNLDRQTDTTMVLVASPPDSSKLHVISSRSIRQSPVLGRSPAMSQLKASFRGIAQHRRQMRSRKLPTIDHILTASSSGEGSDGSSESREGDLRRALDAALNSLDVLKNMYEQRAVRWNDEMTRMHQERENVDFFLKQLVGERQQQVNGINGVLASPAP